MSELVPVPRSTAILPAEIVRENCRAAIAKMPDLISYDPTDEENDTLIIRCATEMGVAAQVRDGWKGNVVTWWVGPYETEDEKTGEIVLLPTLVLITAAGELARYAGWPAIKSWAKIVRAAGAERCRRGIEVVVKRRPSGTAGRSYWQVVADA
jgi:hypothetical protein